MEMCVSSAPLSELDAALPGLVRKIRVLDALAEEQIEAQRARHAAAHGEKGITHG